MEFTVWKIFQLCSTVPVQKGLYIDYADHWYVSWSCTYNINIDIVWKVCWYSGKNVHELELYYVSRTYLLKIFLAKDTYTSTCFVYYLYVDVSLSLSFTATCSNKVVIYMDGTFRYAQDSFLLLSQKFYFNLQSPY